MKISTTGINIKYYRSKKKLSLDELSKKAGVGVSTISQVETGVRQALRSDTISKIAKALKVTTNDLLEMQPSEEPLVSLADLDELIEVISEDEDVHIDGEVLTEREKEDLILGFKVVINLIREKRK